MAEYWDERSVLLTDHRFGYAAGVACRSEPPSLRLPGKTGILGLNGPSRSFAAAPCDWRQRAEPPFMGEIDRLSKAWRSSLFKAL